ncbi:MBL fold metallo-hydrolase [Amycolatopsis deserti]|uniref:MBL fold metallo-hydrolase n=1 Tax=Amycolatopsis deserti TaxID=185696 RepID=A0ABQ3JE46_9PSEU|nr:MBL fold metallo-hydrolase [Amycolatopsis deserti]GHF15127.1 MBL fold metallo-hydrolase [Amycolatopsis deserti]
MSDLSLTVLGSATPYPEPANPCSGYLVSSGETHVWLDAGPGTLAELRRHTSLDRLAGIWISHLHADHCADLLTAYYGALFADLELAAPIPLFGPPGIADRLAGFLTNGPSRSPVERAFAVHELSDGHRAELGPMTFTAAAVEHGMPAFGVRIEAGAASLAYSGDTAPCPAVAALAKNCDALLCEADGPVPSEVHHTPEDAGAAATAAGTRKLILTHVGPFLTPGEAVTRAAARFDGPVAYAAPGAVFHLS